MDIALFVITRTVAFQDLLEKMSLVMLGTLITHALIKKGKM
jgi:hypothetical protein